MLIRALQAAAGNVGAVSGYLIDNSLRFNDGDSAYLSRTPASAGDRKTWTWSGWIKRGNINSAQFIFTANIAAGDESFEFTNSNTLRLRDGNAPTTLLETNALLRDPSGWYHIVLVYDSANSTGAIYVNGVQQSLSTNNISLNRSSAINNNVQHRISGYVVISASYFDGYMAEINFIDGQALTADAFGRIDAATGEWSPKEYSGTYGTNGFYLSFKDGAALGDDTSGNTNDWTPVNLASTDQMLDTPTNNFAVLNPLDSSSSAALSEGNLKTTLSPNVGSAPCYGTIAVSSGKWYMETILNNFSYPGNGVAGTSGFRDKTNSFGGAFSSGSSSWYAIAGGSSVALGFSGSAIGMIMNIAIDFDSGKLWIGRNGVWNGSGDPSTGANPDRTFTPSGIYYPYSEPYRDGVGYWLLTENFGQDSSFAGLKTRQGNTDDNGIGDFYYTPPTGYLALCTDNLPEPAIVDSETQFNVVTYTGNGGTQNIDVGFQPDFVWTKSRNLTYVHGLWDSVRGAGKHLMSNLTNAEVTNDPDGYLSSFNSNGFTLSAGSNSSATWNASGYSYVAWCWKAGGTAVTNTDGSITSQVSANVDAGFSIVGFDLQATGSKTVGHGLNSSPEFIILKSRVNSTIWIVYHSGIAADAETDFLVLNTTAAASDNNTVWDDTKPTSSVFTVGSGFTTANYGTSQIAYCFHSVDGFSKFGSYVGNGSANGPFVYTGFRPAFVMVKNTTTSGTYWVIADSKREPYNTTDSVLFPNTSDAESTNVLFSNDFLSNGFKIRNANNSHNTSGNTYIYMAFAEAPFKNAVAR